MANEQTEITRRDILSKILGGAAVVLATPYDFSVRAQSLEPNSRAIYSTGEYLPVIGLGSWITFNVGRDPVGLRNVSDIIREFFALGGRLIDSSPMYGSAQSSIGQAIGKAGQIETLFAADKIWTTGKAKGLAQYRESLRRWKVPAFSLVQVHNLVDWQTHLSFLLKEKEEGRLKYVGVTTSHGRRHSELEEIMRTQPLDFVQLTYNMSHRRAEDRLLPLAQERGIAVIVNRPYDGGRLIRRAKKHSLPSWLPAEGIYTWADFFLKFNVSHPAVTCVIPATSRLAHLRENMQAGYGKLPDEKLRRRMLGVLGDL